MTKVVITNNVCIDLFIMIVLFLHRKFWDYGKSWHHQALNSDFLCVQISFSLLHIISFCKCKTNNCHGVESPSAVVEIERTTTTTVWFNILVLTCHAKSRPTRLTIVYSYMSFLQELSNWIATHDFRQCEKDISLMISKGDTSWAAASSLRGGLQNQNTSLWEYHCQ